MPDISSTRFHLSSLLLFALVVASLLRPSPAEGQQSPVHTITWDSHSLLLDGHRVLLDSGEFHYWRLPSRELWLDRLQKMKAAGLNAVSIYFDWQYHSNAPGQYDFSGVRDVDYLLSLTDRLGLYVIARVGPYMNAEVDAGGLPGWVLSKQLYPRAQSWSGTTAVAQYSSLYSEYSKEWYDHLLPILARHQVTQGGSILLLSVENEYPQSQGSPQYMQELYNDARSDGIAVPIFHNDYWFEGDWSKLVDLYAYDSYPYGFDCCHQWGDVHFHGIDTWETVLRTQLGITTPMFVSELQGGAFQPWGGQGYDKVAQVFDGGWLTAIDESALAQGTDILNTYMFVGGTSWGYMSEPGVYTSYDYGAPISESGALRPSFYAAHRLAMFLQTFGSQLAGSDFAPSAATASNSQVVIRSRVDSASHDVFTFLRHGDPGPAVQTKLTLNVNGQRVTVPQKAGSFITIPGHGAQIVTSNADLGSFHLNYSTSQVDTVANTDQGPYLLLSGPVGSEGETDFALPAGASISHDLGVQVTRKSNELILNYQHTTQPRTIVLNTATGPLRVIVTSTDAASRYWVADNMLLAGPDLVTQDGNALTLKTSHNRQVTAYGGNPGQSLQLDGRTSAHPDSFMARTLLGRLSAPPAPSLPALTSWKFSPASPETDPAFDDSAWQAADHTSTSNPNVPSTSTLLADDYGFHYGFVWYRGHFTGTGAESGITLSARQSYSVYLNGVYLGSADESLADPPHTYALPRSFAFPSGPIRVGQDNVVSVLTESLGHDEGWIAGPLAQSPQGILSAQLNDSTATVSWRIQGDQGGESPADTERGLLNASGLYGERMRWYLPGYDDSAWQSVSVPDNWKSRAVTAAVGWYRTHFRLDFPSGSDIPVGLELPHVSDKAVIWLNGWLLGRYWEQRGPQHDFFLPRGILNPGGDNVLSIAVWKRGGSGGLTGAPRLVTYQALQSHTLAEVQTPSSSGYWHTQGDEIVDDHNLPVRIAAVNWSGMQNRYYVPSGLDVQPLDSIMGRIGGLGFNTIRLPFSNAMVEQNPVVTERVDANPELKGLHALDILDRIVASAGSHGLRILLDNHRSTLGDDPEPNGLWYTAKYPESSWIHDWQTLAQRYAGNPTVIGVDLRNEPHTGPPGPWSIKTYLSQGATWGPYHGVDNPATDWRLAAERGGDAVLAVNPHLLIFVEGIQQYPDPTQPGGLDSYWWAGILQPAARYPVELDVPHQLVYSPHEYGPFKYEMPYFPAMTYASQVAEWQKHWGFLEAGPAARQTPIFIGEFGTCGSSLRCVDDSAPGSEGLWFRYFSRFLREHPEIGWSFWAVNGTNWAGHVQPNYVFNADWKTVHLHQVVDALRDLEPAPPPN